jgi:hypothetical protein
MCEVPLLIKLYINWTLLQLRKGEMKEGRKEGREGHRNRMYKTTNDENLKTLMSNFKDDLIKNYRFINITNMSISFIVQI